MDEESDLLATEAVVDRYQDLDTWSVGRTLTELVDGNRRAVEAVAAALPQLEAACEATVERLRQGGRLVYVGAGTSGRLALQDAAELPPTFGFDRTVVLLAGGNEAGASAREGAEDDTEAGAHEVRASGVGHPDVLIGVAASGRTPYTVAALREGAVQGALTIGIANNPDTPLLTTAHFPVCLDTGPEVLAGSTRLAAGTAQKVALNALSTASLVPLGGAYRNLMVGMAQSNDKLRRRAVMVVAQATGESETDSREALLEADGSIREAVVRLATGVGQREAREMLAIHNNRVRDVLKALGSSDRK